MSNLASHQQTYLGCLQWQLFASEKEFSPGISLVEKHNMIPLSLVGHPVPVLRPVLVVEDEVEEEYLELLTVVVGDESFVGETSAGPVSLTASPGSVRSEPTIEGRVLVLALPQSAHQELSLAHPRQQEGDQYHWDHAGLVGSHWLS